MSCESGNSAPDHVTDQTLPVAILLRGAIAQHGEGPGPRIGVAQWIKHGVHREDPPGGAGFGMRERFAAHSRSDVMPACEGERRGVRHGEIYVVHACQAGLRAGHVRAAHRGRQWVTRYAVQRFAKGGVGLRTTTVAEMNRSNGVPGIRRTLTRIQLTVPLELEFASELVKRTLLVSPCRQYEAVEQVQTYRLEPSAFRTLSVLRHASRAQLFQRRIKCLTSDEYRRRKPVREREAGTQCQDAMRRTQALFAPADERESQMMMPVARIERDGLACGSDRFGSAAASVQDERKRAPRFARGRIEPASFAGMVHGVAKRLEIRRRMRARRLKRKGAGVRHADMSRRIVRLCTQRLRKRGTCVRHRIAVERFERGAPLDKRAIGSEQCVERRV